MKATKVNKPKSIYQAAIRSITDVSSDRIYDTSSLSEIFATPLYFMGDDKCAKADDLQNLENLLKSQKSQLKQSGTAGSLISRPIFQSFSPNEDSAVYVDELYLEHENLNGSPGFPIKISLILFKLEEGWRVKHIHLSGSSNSVNPSTLPQEKSGEKNIEDLERTLKERTAELEQNKLKFEAIQAQLLRQEKLASLGQLTAGIAHEIKNPLNFINNFSELSSEFLEEIEENLQKLESNDTTEEIRFLLEDVKANLEKIHQHGTRADGIVKSMLLHSRGGSGKMEDIDLNALIREYVNLSFHGMRANKNPINVGIQIETDENLGTVKINPESFSRVVLNLCKNAYDAMREKLEKEKQNYLPRLIVRTKSFPEKVVLEIEDNGPGVPEEIREKMMLPFFTTKKGSDGTGLGLSISQDIIKDHDGTLEIETRKNTFTRFIIVLHRKN